MITRRSEYACHAACEPVIRFRHGQAAWHIREGWRHLLDSAMPDWFALETDARAHPVKRGYARTTWRVNLAEADVYAKVFDSSGLFSRVKRQLLGGSAEREWRAAREAETRGVPTAHVIAWGIQEGAPSREVFLSEGLGDARNLADIWERDVACSSPSGRHAAAGPLITAAAELFATAHERGFVHGDGHPNNILVRSVPGGRFELYYVDVRSARITKRPASVGRSVESLAQLEQYFRRRATRSERMGFLRAYLRRRPSMARYSTGRSDLEELLAALDRSTAAGAAHLARTRDRRLRYDGKYFCRLSLGGGWGGTVALRLERRHLFPERGVPDRTESDWRALLSPLIEGRGVTPPDVRQGPARGLAVEVVRLGGFWGRLSATLRGSEHRRLFTRSHKLRHRDVASNLILGYLELRRHGLIRATVLIRPADTSAP